MTDLVTTGEPVAPIDWKAPAAPAPAAALPAPGPWRAHKRAAHDWIVVRDGPIGLEYATPAASTMMSSQRAHDYAKRLNTAPPELNLAEQMRDYGMGIGAAAVVVMVAMPAADGQHATHWVWRGHPELCKGLFNTCSPLLAEALANPRPGP